MFHVSKFYFIIAGILVVIIVIIVFMLLEQSFTPATPPVSPTPTPIYIDHTSILPSSAPLQLSSPRKSYLQSMSIGTPIIIQTNISSRPINLNYTITPPIDIEYYGDNSQVKIVPKTFWTPNIQYTLKIKNITYVDGSTQLLNTIISFQAKGGDDNDDVQSSVEQFGHP